MDWIEKKGSTVCIKPREYEYRKTSAFKKKIGHRSNIAALQKIGRWHYEKAAT
ncbi:hypothetical protein [Megasphaera sp.]|uniref:hypothetical protein n=1 Tax=Megasphaera sp. TaxID=2023260 RepID=UPI00307AAAE3